LADLGTRHLQRRVVGVWILQRVDQRDGVAAGARDRPQLVQRRDTRARDLGQAVLELILGDAQRLGELLVRRRTVVLALELDDRALDLAGTAAHRARHPVHRPQLVDDRALDAADRVRL